MPTNLGVSSNESNNQFYWVDKTKSTVRTSTIRFHQLNQEPYSSFIQHQTMFRGCANKKTVHGSHLNHLQPSFHPSSNSLLTCNCLSSPAKTAAGPQSFFSIKLCIVFSLYLRSTQGNLCASLNLSTHWNAVFIRPWAKHSSTKAHWYFDPNSATHFTANPSLPSATMTERRRSMGKWLEVFWQHTGPLMQG